MLIALRLLWEFLGLAVNLIEDFNAFLTQARNYDTPHFCSYLFL